ncbi:spermidine/putrescine ABC transporter substrate-binding protein, partial [Klebsiella pneumoniae]
MSKKIARCSLYVLGMACLTVQAAEPLTSREKKEGRRERREGKGERERGKKEKKEEGGRKGEKD